MVSGSKMSTMSWTSENHQGLQKGLLNLCLEEKVYKRPGIHKRLSMLVKVNGVVNTWQEKKRGKETLHFYFAF